MFNYEVIADFSVLILVQIKGIFYPKKIKEIGCPNKYWTLINERQKKNSWKFVYILVSSSADLPSIWQLFWEKKSKFWFHIFFEIFSKNLLEHPVGIHCVRSPIEFEKLGELWDWEMSEFYLLDDVLLYKIPDEKSCILPKMQIWLF